VTRVHYQEHQPFIVDGVQDSVVICDFDPQNPVHPVSIFAPADSDRPAAILSRPLMRSTTGRSSFRRARKAFGANASA
jgi:hypothetical protein